jgi:sugar phosphate isomerase/epimerase
MNFSRRDFARLAIGAPLIAAVRPAFASINSKFDGVMIGAQTYSFRELPSLDGCIRGMQEVGLGYAELWEAQVAPRGDKLAAWRTNPPIDEIRAVHKKFDDAGIELYAYNYSFRDDFTDEQIEQGFLMARALGVSRITASSNVDISPRVDKYAQQYGIYVGYHNHDSMKPNEFSTPDDWKQALAGRSTYTGINLDIGHFTAAGFDPVAFLEEHHSQILTLHIKDRKKNHGANMSFGEGDTNIKGVLQLLKTKKYPIPAMIEYEYNKPGVLDTVTEMKKCLEYCKTALA